MSKRRERRMNRKKAIPLSMALLIVAVAPHSTVLRVPVDKDRIH
jgi:hypothetical protein